MPDEVCLTESDVINRQWIICLTWDNRVFISTYPHKDTSRYPELQQSAMYLFQCVQFVKGAT